MGQKDESFVSFCAGVVTQVVKPLIVQAEKTGQDPIPAEVQRAVLDSVSRGSQRRKDAIR